MCINTLKHWGRVCCVVEVNFLIPCLFSFPAPALTPQLTTGTSLVPTKAASPITSSTHTLHSLISLVTELPTKGKATETPEVPNTTPSSTDPFTKVPSNKSVDPANGRKDNPVAYRAMTGKVFLVIVVPVIAILLKTLCFCCKNRYVCGVSKFKCGRLGSCQPGCPPQPDLYYNHNIINYTSWITLKASEQDWGQLSIHTGLHNWKSYYGWGKRSEIVDQETQLPMFGQLTPLPGSGGLWENISHWFCFTQLVEIFSSSFPWLFKNPSQPKSRKKTNNQEKIQFF